MNILYLQPQPCIRALKLASALKKDKLFFAYIEKTLDEFYGHGNELFEAWIKLPRTRTGQIKEIKKIVKEYDIELIHSHNAPDFLTVAAIKAMNGKVPIIHDNHDLLSLRKTPYYFYARWNWKRVLREERIANIRSNGKICVTEGLMKVVRKKYKATNDLVFPNFVSKVLVPKRKHKKLSEEDGELHIAYEGSITTQPNSHYDLTNIFKAIAKQQIHLHIYTANAKRKEGTKVYLRLRKGSFSRYIHYHGSLEPRRLMEELTRYDFGWAGFNWVLNKKHLDVVLANKVMEYAVCGLPVLSFPHKTQKEFIEKHQIGFIIKSVADIKAISKAESEKVRHNLARNRNQFILENQIGQLIAFYNSFIR